MKKLSGEFLSKISWALLQANRNELSKNDILGLIEKAFDVENLYVNLQKTLKPSAGGTCERVSTFDDGNLDGLNIMLPWASFSSLGNNRILGSAWSERKRNAPVFYPDDLVSKLNSIVPMRGMSVIEFGCFEGHHSISLARFAKEVWAIDGRIENVLKSLVRVWMEGLERKIAVNLLDLEKGNLKEQLAGLGRKDGFDLLHHRGVLYHLSNPVDHLIQCADICKKHFYLHTQIIEDNKANDSIKMNQANYEVAKFNEKASEFSPFAGISTFALRMTESSLSRLLNELGFRQITVLGREQERNGLRIELLATR